jgi:hypothetical protein
MVNNSWRYIQYMVNNLLNIQYMVNNNNNSYHILYNDNNSYHYSIIILIHTLYTSLTHIFFNTFLIT